MNPINLNEYPKFVDHNPDVGKVDHRLPQPKKSFDEDFINKGKKSKKDGENSDQGDLGDVLPKPFH